MRQTLRKATETIRGRSEGLLRPAPFARGLLAAGLLATGLLGTGCFGEVAAEMRFRDSVQLHRSGRYEEALRHYQVLITDDPSRDGVLSNMGLLYLQTRRPRQAEAALRRAIEINERNVIGRYLLAMTLLATQRRDEARRETVRTLTHRQQWIAEARTRHGTVEESRIDGRIVSEMFAARLDALCRETGLPAAAVRRVPSTGPMAGDLTIATLTTRDGK
ncbi:MAG: tetratricopeptide repeat protein [Deltaproteobacteria bacterium]|nr:tetratricopeptide repeat protein [Deltaproteobacteria bacterium]